MKQSYKPSGQGNPEEPSFKYFPITASSRTWQRRNAVLNSRTSGRKCILPNSSDTI